MLISAIVMIALVVVVRRISSPIVALSLIMPVGHKVRHIMLRLRVHLLRVGVTRVARRDLMMLMVLVVAMMMAATPVATPMVLHRRHGVAIVGVAVDAAPEHIVALPLQLNSDLSVDEL